MEMWELIIYCDNGVAYSILGDEDTLKGEIQAWQEFQQRSTAEFEEHQAQPEFMTDKPYESALGFDVRTINGYAKDVGRFPPAIVAYRFNEVQGMTVTRVL